MTGFDRSKVCASCGRSFEWRKKWAATWNEVRYCSAACRSRRVGAVDRRLEQEILRLAGARSPAGSICPSEPARAVGGDDWRRLMEPTRRAARRLAAAGQVEIMQAGRVVDPAAIRGPVRIRLTR